jgi:hypothetical protein
VKLVFFYLHNKTYVAQYLGINPNNEYGMSIKIDQSSLNALKIAFTYMPRPIEVTKYEYGDRYQKVLDQIDKVREVLLINDVDPDEVYGEVNPESSPNSTY